MKLLTSTVSCRNVKGWLKSYITYDDSYFQTVFLKLLNKHTPIKKILCFSNNPFMSKALRKAITRRTKFKNIYNKCRTEGNWSNYEKKKKSLCYSAS